MFNNFKTVLFILHIIALTLGSDREDYEHYPEINGYLKLHTESADWLTARESCHKEDAYLASPWTPKFTSVVSELLLNDEQSTEEQSLSLVFSGTITLFTEGMLFAANLSNAPIHSERCGVFFDNGTTGDFDCKHKLPFVCYAPDTKPGLIPTPTFSTAAPIPSCDGLGYELANQTMSCYKFHGDGEIWTDAKRICTSEGASLTVINSDVEAGVLKTLFEQHASSIRYVSDIDKDFAAVGIFFESGVWKTSSGQTLDQAGYAKWWLGSPDNYQLNYPYGAMHRNGTYNPANNNGRIAFICEKAPVYKA